MRAGWKPNGSGFAATAGVLGVDGSSKNTLVVRSPPQPVLFAIASAPAAPSAAATIATAATAFARIATSVPTLPVFPLDLSRSSRALGVADRHEVGTKLA